MRSSFLDDYITERYGNVVKPGQGWKYAAWLRDNGYVVYETSYGFFSAKLAGDALILRDMYTASEHRSKGRAWDLFDHVRQLAKHCGKNVIITFSQFDGQGREHGLGAINAAEFKPLFTTKTEEVFIRGVY